jgi:hypothetical protein
MQCHSRHELSASERCLHTANTHAALKLGVCFVHAPGRWNVLFAGLLLLACATAMYGLATSVGSLILASTLHGTSLSFIHVSSLALLSAFPLRLVLSLSVYVCVYTYYCCYSLLISIENSVSMCC